MTLTAAAAKSLAYRLELGSRTNRLTLAPVESATRCPACYSYVPDGSYWTRYTDSNGQQYDYCQTCAPW